MPDTETQAPSQTTTTDSRARTPSSARPTATPSGALKVQLRAADFAAGEAMLAPRPAHPVQRKLAAVQRTDDASAMECSDTADASSDEIGAAPIDAGVDPATEMCSVTEDLGEMSSFAAALHMLGSALDPLAPGIGTGVKLTAKASVTASGVYASIGFECELKRSAAGLAGTILLSGSVGVGTQTGASSAYAALKISNSLSVKGDSGAECADLAGLWAYEYLSSQPDSAWEYLTNPQMAAARVTGLSKLAADTLWGEGFPAAVLAQMDPASSGAEADIVSQSTRAGIEGEVKDTSTGEKAAAAGELSANHMTTLGKDDSGQLTRTAGTSLYMSGKVDILGGRGSFTWDGATGLKTSLALPIPQGLAGPAQAVVVAFGSMIDEAFRQLRTGEALDPVTADTAIATITSWQAPLTSALEETGLAKGLLEFELTMDLKGKLSVTVAKVSEAKLPVEGLGGGVAGVGLEAKAASKTVILKLP